MNMTNVESSNVLAVGYDNGTLEVHFHSGGKYQYFDVPASVYENFLNADSKGKFLHYNIKNKYRYRRLN